MSYVAVMGSHDLNDAPIFVSNDRARAIEVAEARLQQQLLDAEMADEYEVVVLDDEDCLQVIVAHIDGEDDPEDGATDWIVLIEVEDV